MTTPQASSPTPPCGPRSQLAEDNAFAVDSAITDPFPNARGWTMMFLAMHDALNAIEQKFRQDAFFGTGTSAHTIAAAAQATHDVMNHIYPARQAANDTELAFWLGQVPDGSRKADGIDLGMASAAAIINARSNDSMLVFGEYALQDPLEPGDYRFVSSVDFVYRPAFGDATPFAIGSGADFLPDPPPPLTDTRKLDLLDAVRMFALANMVLRLLDHRRRGVRAGRGPLAGVAGGRGGGSRHPPRQDHVPADPGVAKCAAAGTLLREAPHGEGM